MAKTEYDQVVLSKESLMEQFHQNRSTGASAVAIGAAVVAVALLALGMMNRDALWICVLLSGSCVVGCVFALWVKQREEEENRASLEAIRDGQMFFVKNRVTDKDSGDASSADSPAASVQYRLYFHKTAKEGRRCIAVDRQEYLCASEGDKYYLLYLGGRLMRVFPCYKYRFGEDLKTYLMKDPEVIGSPELSEYEQYRKLERQTGVLAKKQWLKTHKSLPEPDT